VLFRSTDALVAAGVSRVVVGVRDPDPRVNGAGLARLRSAGIEVVEGVLEDEAADVVAGFVTRVQRGRPLVTLKLATTLDGRIATRTGEVLSRLTTDIQIIENLLATTASVFLRNTLIMIGSLILMLWVSPKLTLLVLLIIPVVVVPLFLFARPLRNLTTATQDEFARAVGHAGEIVTGMTPSDTRSGEPTRSIEREP
jgi:ABC-type multidrug transport system fused ATPase/permease subunit